MIACLNAAETSVIETIQTTIDYTSTTTTYGTDVNLFVVNKIKQPIPARPVNARLWIFHNVSSWQIQTDSINHRTSIYYWAQQSSGTYVKPRGFNWEPNNQCCNRRSWDSYHEQFELLINSQSQNNVIICGLVRNDELHSQLKGSGIENMPDTKIISKEEAKCEEFFRNEHKRTTNGKFELISLSFREDPNVFGESKINALKRLHHLEIPKGSSIANPVHQFYERIYQT